MKNIKMWPKYLDHSREQCLGILRNLECSAYSSVVDAFRAGGQLTEEKKATLLELARILNIPTDRHKTEIRRANNDEQLSTVAYRLAGHDQTYSWALEGRRIVPLLPRVSPVTGLTQIANAGSKDLASHNKPILPPDKTASHPLPPKLPLPPYMAPPVTTAQSNEETSKSEVQPPQNGVKSPPVEVKAETAEDDVGNENGFVVLPSGMAVRLKDNTPPPSKRGKRKRSASKSIEVFPGGIPDMRPKENLAGPPRKQSSVVGAGHGYARPLPTESPSSQTGNNEVVPQQKSLNNKVVSVTSSEQPFDIPLSAPLKRGPGRPPGPSSPAGVYHTTRGRPRLTGPGSRGGRGSRGPRGPRPGGVLITPRVCSTPPTQFVSDPMLISQTEPVQVSLHQSFQQPRMTLRPTVPNLSGTTARPTTIQLKQEHVQAPSNSLQGLKVISHSATKIVPKSGSTAVYVVPGTRPVSTPPQRVVAVNSNGQRVVSALTNLAPVQRVISPTIPGVIRTVRAKQPGSIAGKPSVIVVQKGGSGGIRAARPSTVALYRPARAVPSSTGPLTSRSLVGSSSGGIGLMNAPMGAIRLPRPANITGTQRSIPSSDNVILLDLSQDQSNPALANLLSASGFLSEGDGMNRTLATSISTSESGIKTEPIQQRKFVVQKPVGGATEGQMWSVQPVLSSAGDISIVSSMQCSTVQNSGLNFRTVQSHHSNYQDIFAATLQQRLEEESQNASNPSPNNFAYVNNETPSLHSNILSGLSRANTPTVNSLGRMVTLPHRPTFSKAVQEQFSKVVQEQHFNTNTANVCDQMNDVWPNKSNEELENSGGNSLVHTDQQLDA